MTAARSAPPCSSGRRSALAVGGLDGGRGPWDTRSMPSLRRGIWLPSVCALAVAAGTISEPSVAAPTSGATTANACAITQTKSLEGTVRTNIRFVNKTSGAVKIYWLDYTGKRVLYKTLGAGASYVQQTWVTHPWVAINAAGACIGYVIAPKTEYVITEGGGGGAASRGRRSRRSPRSSARSSSTARARRAPLRSQTPASGGRRRPRAPSRSPRRVERSGPPAPSQGHRALLESRAARSRICRRRTWYRVSPLRSPRATRATRCSRRRPVDRATSRRRCSARARSPKPARAASPPTL